MKKFLVILALMFILPAFADTAPFYMDAIPKTAIGLYQTDNEIQIFENPDANSKTIKSYTFSYKPEDMPANMFAFLLNEKNLGFLYVSDIDEDGWIEVIYDKKMGYKGWVHTSDRMQFLPWINFYNLYGRKYGLRILKDSPSDSYTLRSKSEDLSQGISKLNYVQKIRLTKISGNWALVTALDIEKTPKTGWLKWRDTDGRIYAFPDIK